MYMITATFEEKLGFLLVTCVDGLDFTVIKTECISNTPIQISSLIADVCRSKKQTNAKDLLVGKAFHIQVVPLNFK